MEDLARLGRGLAGFGFPECVSNLLARTQVDWGGRMHAYMWTPSSALVCMLGRCRRYAADQFKPYKPIVVQ